MEAGELGELTEHTDLMLKVFSKLPVYKAAQFRLVCRRWNAALSNPNFAALLYLNSPETAWFVINLKELNLTTGIRVDVLAAYSCSAKTWFQFPLSFLGRLGIRHAVSSSAGLVALFIWPQRIYPPEQHQIVVFDPRKASLVSRIDTPLNMDVSWAEKFLTVGPLALIPSGDPSNNFKLVAYSLGEKNSLLTFKCSFWVYDSLGKSWTKVEAFWFKFIHVKPCSLVSGTCAYFLGRCHDRLVHIVVYNSHTNEITVEEGRIPAEFKRRVGIVVSPNLFCCRGKLTMCDIKDEGCSSQDEEETYEYWDDHGSQSALVIWEREFEDSAGNWKEVARMPQEMWTEIYSKVECPVDGMNFPRMRICGSVNLVFLQLKGWNALVCNLDTGSWEYLPPLPKEIGQKTFQVKDVFVLDLV